VTSIKFPSYYKVIFTGFNILTACDHAGFPRRSAFVCPDCPGAVLSETAITVSLSTASGPSREFLVRPSSYRTINLKSPFVRHIEGILDLIFTSFIH